MRSALTVVGLSFAIALAFVVVADRGPTGSIGGAPFANLHGGLPQGLEAYRNQVQGTRGGGLGEGTFEWSAETPDPAATVLAFYDQTIDRTLWDVIAVGEQTVSFSYRPNARVRGGVRTVDTGRSTFLVVWVTDLSLPSGFPATFPGGYRARPIGAARSDGTGYELRWDIDGNLDSGRFIDDFAHVLTDAGWDVVTLTTTGATPGLICRSRSTPSLTCAVTTSYELDTTKSTGIVYSVHGSYVATVRLDGLSGR